MKIIKTYSYFINENKQENITLGNISELLPNFEMLIEGDVNLKKGLEFTKKETKDFTDFSEYQKDDFVKQMIDGFIEKLNAFLKEKRIYKQLFKEEDKGYSGNKFVGRDYKKTKDLPVKEIAKLIKQELNIKYPDCKFSVKTDTFSGGQSIRLSVEDIDFDPYNKEGKDKLINNEELFPRDLSRSRDYVYNDKFITLKTDVKRIGQQYNYDDSDSQIDYFSTHYYFSDVYEMENITLKFYPDYEPFVKNKQRYEEFDKRWEESKRKEKEKADAIKANFKFNKNDLIWYTHSVNSKNLANGEYPGKILKAPSGRGKSLPKYEVEFYVKREGFRDATYRVDLYNDNKLRKREED